MHANVNLAFQSNSPTTTASVITKLPLTKPVAVRPGHQLHSQRLALIQDKSSKQTMRAQLLRLSIWGTTSLGVLNCLGAHAVNPATASAATPVPFHELNESTASLKLVQVVFRHGARTPLSKKEELWRQMETQWDVCRQAYDMVPLTLTTSDGGQVPKNVHDLKQVNYVLPGGCHMGQLTEAGQHQAKELGQWLRQRYVQERNLLPSSYQDGMLQARTTNFQRTIATLAGVLTGLLGTHKTGPVPVVTSSDFDEILYADTKQCPHLKIYMKMCKETAQRLVRSDHEYSWVCEELKRLGLLEGDDDAAQRDWVFADLHDVVTSLRAAGKPVPSDISPRLIQALNRLATKEFAPMVAPSVNDAHGHAVLRLSMGVLLHTLVERMQAAASNDTGGNSNSNSQGNGNGPQPKLYLYSGHDSTIMPILSALGCDTLQSWPPYLSNVVFELWQLPQEQGGHHVVRVLYNKERLDIPHCPPGKYATLDTFKTEVIGPFLISQQAITEACKVPVEHDTSLPHLADDVSLSSPSSGDEQEDASMSSPSTSGGSKSSKSKL